MERSKGSGSPGRVGATVEDSVPWWEGPVSPPPGAPNILLIVLDDLGYAQLGCYGGPMSTPNIDALASAGAQFTNFHVTPLCSPTRASLLTGRNHHSVGMGCLSDWDTGFPSQRGAIAHSAGLLPEMLGPTGYHTYCVGKWHLAPYSSITPIGPFDQWPIARGFDHYYGFLWGETDQWHPQLWRDNGSCPTPSRQGYHLSEDLVDEAIRNISDVVSSGSSNPFFMYLAFGAAHAPHQAPSSYIDNYRGKFDEGWDAAREKALRIQIEKGIVPRETQLPPSNPDVPAWDDLDDDHKKLYARMQEVFAGFVEHTDAQIGRLVRFLDEEDILEDTLVVLLSDNGASGEGGESGSWNEYRYFLRLPDDFSENLAHMDQLGSEATHNHYPSGWAQAGNTPGRYYKKFTHAGGVRTPLMVRWPKGGIRAGVRKEFRHVTDIVPTVLDLVGIEAPKALKGVEQMPIHGRSFVESLNGSSGKSRGGSQYFEMLGNRAIVHDGWKAVTRHVEGTPYDNDRWELYRLEEDVSETHDMAATQPKVLDRLKDLWWDEAKKYDALPLDDRLQGRADVRRGDQPSGRRTFRLLPGGSPIMSQAAPDFYDRSFGITAVMKARSEGDKGVIIAQGHRANGWSLFINKNHLFLDYNLAGQHCILMSSSEVPEGDCTIVWEMVRTGRARANAFLRINGEEVARTEALETIPNFFGPHSVQIGWNGPSAVSASYSAPFADSGCLSHILVDLEDDKGQTPSSLRTALASE